MERVGRCNWGRLCLSQIDMVGLSADVVPTSSSGLTNPPRQSIRKLVSYDLCPLPESKSFPVYCASRQKDSTKSPITGILLSDEKKQKLEELKGL